MSEVIKLNKGFDINLAGKAEKQIATVQSRTYAIKPSDFLGMYRPKVLIKEGDVVKAGTPLFFDKQFPSVLYVAPVSGEVVKVNRGEQRVLLDIVILADSTIEYETFPKYTNSELSSLKVEDIKTTLLKSGTWINIIQRPYGIVADPEVSPKAVFVSAFDSHPLAPDYEFIFKGQEAYFQAGLEILSRLVGKNVHVGVSAKTEVSKIFTPSKHAQIHKFQGKHPAGNVGVQIHHISPISKGETVWTLHPYGVIQIGKLFLEGKYDASKIIAVAGSEVKTPQYYKTFVGANVEKFVEGNLKSDHVRFVSGNALTGTKIDKKGYLGFYDNLLTVLPEGDRPRFLLTDGWLAPTAKRLSYHRAFGLLSFLNPSNKEYALDTSTNGEERAFVMTGAYESVVPMDLYPEYLMKAILANDLEEMEALGIYEVIEEDLALCEFIDVSKQNFQELLREGINTLREG